METVPEVAGLGPSRSQLRHRIATLGPEPSLARPVRPAIADLRHLDRLAGAHGASSGTVAQAGLPSWPVPRMRVSNAVSGAAIAADTSAGVIEYRGTLIR